jgi:hypothetical protein
VAELHNDEQIDAAIKLGIFSFAFCFNNQISTPSIEQEDLRALKDIRYLESQTNPSSIEREDPAKELCLLLDLNRNQLPVLSDGEREALFHGLGNIVDPEAPRLTYRIPEDGIFEISAVGCEERSHGDDCHRDDCCRLQADQAIESIMLDRLIQNANSMAQSVNIDSIVQSPYVLDLDLDYFRTVKSLFPDDSVVFYRLIRNAVGITIATEPNYVKLTRLDEDLTSECALKKIVGHIVKALA